jgi:membrane protease YdiL (CAAX protease family)
MNTSLRLRTWLVVCALSLVFCLAVGLSSGFLRWLFANYAAVSLRHQATLRITGAVIGQVATVLLLISYLRWQRRSLADLGLSGSAPAWGWISAFVLAAVISSLILLGPLRGGAPLSELSLFHIYNSLAAGLGAGFCEEIVFRGFVMSALSWAGSGRLAQVLVSALLFGLAHVGWTAIGPGFNARVFSSSVLPTAVFGALYAGIYLISKRSLMPVIMAHAITDMLIEPWLLLGALSGTLGQQ